MENANPILNKDLSEKVEVKFKNGKLEEVNTATVFELIRNIVDPEHPYTLEQLNVVSKEDIEIGAVEDEEIICRKGLPIKYVKVTFTPTVPHCSMAGLIGLCIKAQLDKYIGKYWNRVYIKENTHANYIALNKQFNDKDRVTAALENENIIDSLISNLPTFDISN